MYLTPKDKEIIDTIVTDQRVSIQTATYTAYVELTPKNKKPISQREFHQIFKDNWQVFFDIEESERDV